MGFPKGQKKEMGVPVIMDSLRPHPPPPKGAEEPFQKDIKKTKE